MILIKMNNTPNKYGSHEYQENDNLGKLLKLWFQRKTPMEDLT